MNRPKSPTSATSVTADINTHEHPDHVLGDTAFKGLGAVAVGHQNLPKALADRFSFYLQSFAPQLGQAAMVRAVMPKLLVPDTRPHDTMRLDLSGRTLLLTAWSPPAHTECDLTVLDEATHTLYAGDLVFLQHVPVVDGSVVGWLNVLPRLAKRPAPGSSLGTGGSWRPGPRRSMTNAGSSPRSSPIRAG